MTNNIDWFQAFNDLVIEKPQYAVIDVTYLESFGNYLYSYVLDNYEISNCEEKYCMKLSSNE